MNRLINEELNKMKYLLGYQRGMVLSEQGFSQVVQGGVDALKSQNTATAAAPASGVEDVVKQIQTVLNTKYGTKLAVDGKWGNLTQTAFETAVKSKTAAPATPAAPAAPATSGTTAPAATTTTPPVAPAAPVAEPAAPVAEPATQTPEEITGTEVAQPTRRDMRRDRQDLRRSNRRAMQDLRTQQRAQ